MSLSSISKPPNRSLSAFRATQAEESFPPPLLSASQVRPLWTEERLLDYSRDQGVIVSLSTLGPGFRSVARSTQNETEIIGYIEGFVRGKLLHLDKMEVFRPMVKRVRLNNPEFTGGGTVLGVGLLMGYTCLLHGQRKGCEVAEFLAIDDDELQHKRLVKLYRNSGFDYVKYVGDDWGDIPDRMVWGGCGTLLRKDIPFLLRFWTGLLDKSLHKNEDA